MISIYYEQPSRIYVDIIFHGRHQPLGPRMKVSELTLQRTLKNDRSLDLPGKFKMFGHYSLQPTGHVTSIVGRILRVSLTLTPPLHSSFFFPLFTLIVLWRCTARLESGTGHQLAALACITSLALVTTQEVTLTPWSRRHRLPLVPHHQNLTDAGGLTVRIILSWAPRLSRRTISSTMVVIKSECHHHGDVAVDSSYIKTKLERSDSLKPTDYVLPSPYPYEDSKLSCSGNDDWLNVC
jgi:hypothetical protein